MPSIFILGAAKFSNFYLNSNCLIVLIVNVETVQNYRVLWTGVGAQLARDVPFSGICWSTLEPVSVCSLCLGDK